MTIDAQLNEHLRDAMVAYYLDEVVPNSPELKALGLDSKLKTANDLYEFLLLDTQVTQAVETSPVASAVASLQQYVNSTLLGMEPGYTDVKFEEELVTEWRDQRSQYPLWAANQQLAWYPSLYLDPSLRMKKSSYFQQLENDINQNRITLDTTQEAVQAYLASFEEVANLSIINGYIASTDFANGTYYFIGKSRAEGAYYWRSVDMSERAFIAGTEGPKHDAPSPGAWSDWKKANLPISDSALEHTIRPVYFNNRLFVVWVEETANVVPPDVNNATDPVKKDGEYVFPVKDEKRLVTTTKKLRLNMTYKKYDDSWSAPQCYMEIDANDKAFESTAGLKTIQTIATVNRTTSPESIYLAVYAGYRPDTTPTEANRDGLDDKYAVLRTLEIDKNFNVTALFPATGTYPGRQAAPTRAKDLMVLRAGVLFAQFNANAFQFPLMVATEIRLNSVQTTAPHAGTSGQYGWNHNNAQSGIKDINGIAATSAVTFDKNTNKVTIKSATGRAFETSNVIRMQLGSATLGSGLNLVLDTKGLPTGYATLLAGSEIYGFPELLRGSPALQITTTLLLGSIKLVSNSAQDDKVNVVVTNGRASLVGKVVNISAIQFLMNRTEEFWLFHISSNTATYDFILPKRFTNSVTNYQQYIARSRSMASPTPANLGQKVNLHDGVKKAQLPANATEQVVILIDPETLLPAWSVTDWPANSTTFTVIHGLWISELENGRTLSIGHGVKATAIELVRRTLNGVIRAPRVNTHSSPTLGIAEFIDFTGSSINKNDQNNANRNPIRMNTLFARNLIERANIALENLLSWETQQLPEPSLGATGDQPMMDFKGANGLYFWELFMHLPFMISHRLNQEQQFTEAETWLNFIFDPARGENISGRPKYWNVRPLTELPGRDMATRAPIDPDGIAAENPVHYRKAVYNHYIKNLLDRGDAAYRQLTPDALGEAKLWYVRVLDLLGPRPDKRLVSGWSPVTLGALATSANGRLREYEIKLNEQQRLVDESAAANDGQSLITFTQPQLRLQTYSNDPTLPELDNPYAKVALNRELVQNWDTAESRLYNLRHNRTLDGKPLQLPLFAAPLDPRAMMSAFGSGASSTALAQLMNRDIPHYRFRVMYQHASNAVESVIQFGSTLLSLLERRDNAQLQEMSQQQAWDMAKEAINLQLQVQAVEGKAREALLAGRKIVESRLAHYEVLVNEIVSVAELSAGALHMAGRVAEGAAITAKAIGEGLKVAPNAAGGVGGAIAGMAGGVTAGAHAGGWRLEGVANMASAAAAGMATAHHASAEALDRAEQYRRRHQDWTLAQTQAQLDLEQIDAQLAVHDEQARLSALQLRQSQTLLEQAATTYQFLSKRFTNAQLYQWLNGQFATFYYQAYDTTLSLCLAAEACWQYEIADFTTRFIRPGAWKDNYRGLTAGESLKLSLMKMDAAYLQRNARHLEITKTVSVKGLVETPEKTWTQIVSGLTASKGLDFQLTQAMYQQDYPNHFLRRIKRISVTLPAVLGPYEDVHAILTQTGSKVEMTATVGANVRENLRASQQIALSSGIDDDGMFTLNFDDERYLPFEGTGAVSNWNLLFTNPSPQLLASLSDVIVRVSYTATNV